MLGSNLKFFTVVFLTTISMSITCIIHVTFQEDCEQHLKQYSD